MASRRHQVGFTIIELIIVIIIIAVLAAVAIPKFINLSSNAQTAATTAIAGALSAANANNFAARKLPNPPSTSVAITNCVDMTNALQGGIPSSYSIVSGAVAADTSVSCTLNGPGSTTATFTATGTT